PAEDAGLAMKIDPPVDRRKPSQTGAGAPNRATPLGLLGRRVERLTDLRIEHVPVGQLRPTPRNARLHSERQLKQIARSIEAFGFNVPVLADRDGNILAGHGRVQAARRRGLRAVPVIRLHHLTPEQASAFSIADNRLTESSTWDDRMLAEILR